MLTLLVGTAVHAQVPSTNDTSDALHGLTPNGTNCSTSNGACNTAAGYQALFANATGSDNIEIGNSDAAADNKVIKIGTEGTQQRTFVAGIYSNTAVSGLTVVVGSHGELGAVSSSERFKTTIAPMGSNTAKLQQLRPATFQYKTDPQGTLRYGLIAEEVATVYPELVVRDNQGRIDGVRYDEFAPILLNEVQKQAAEIRELKDQFAGIQASLAKLQPKDQLVAQH